MYYYIEQVARQREQEVARRSRSPLFAYERDAQLARAARRRSTRSGSRLWSRWPRRWRPRAARPGEVHCTRAAAWARG